jgi:hypothetical protein
MTSNADIGLFTDSSGWCEKQPRSCRKKSRFMTGKYREVLDRVMLLIRVKIEDPRERQFLEAVTRKIYAA